VFYNHKFFQLRLIRENLSNGDYSLAQHFVASMMKVKMFYDFDFRFQELQANGFRSGKELKKKKGKRESKKFRRKKDGEVENLK